MFRFLTKSSEIKLAWEPLSNSVSILVCLETTLIWKSSFIVSSSWVTLEQLEELVFAMFLPFKLIDVTFVLSLESKTKSCSMIAQVSPFSLDLSLFGFNSGWSCQQWS